MRDHDFHYRASELITNVHTHTTSVKSRRRPDAACPLREILGTTASSRPTRIIRDCTYPCLGTHANYPNTANLLRRSFFDASLQRLEMLHEDLPCFAVTLNAAVENDASIDTARFLLSSPAVTTVCCNSGQTVPPFLKYVVMARDSLTSNRPQSPCYVAVDRLLEHTQALGGKHR